MSEKLRFASLLCLAPRAHPITTSVPSRPTSAASSSPSATWIRNEDFKGRTVGVGFWKSKRKRLSTLWKPWTTLFVESGESSASPCNDKISGSGTKARYSRVPLAVPLRETEPTTAFIGSLSEGDNENTRGNSSALGDERRCPPRLRTVQTQKLTDGSPGVAQ